MLLRDSWTGTIVESDGAAVEEVRRHPDFWMVKSVPVPSERLKDLKMDAVGPESGRLEQI